MLGAVILVAACAALPVVYVTVAVLVEVVVQAVAVAVMPVAALGKPVGRRYRGSTQGGGLAGLLAAG